MSSGAKSTVLEKQLAMTVEREVKKSLDPLNSLLKALEQPATKANMTPQAYLEAIAGHGRGGVVVSGNGGVLPVQPSRNKCIGWGELLKGLTVINNPQESPDQRAQYQRKLFGNTREGGMGITKASLAEGGGTTGGYTVPPQFASQLLTLAMEESIVRPRATVMPMTGLLMQIPALDVAKVRSAGQTPFLGGIVASWTAEGATRDQSEPEFRQIELRAHELSFYTVASNSLLADNAVGLDALLSMLFSMAIGWYTDYAYLRGDGVGKPLGILNAAATIAVTRSSATTFKFADAANMMARLYWLLRSGPSVAWVINPSVIPQVLQMADAANRPVFIPLSSGVQAPIPESAGVQSIGMLFGIPVLVSDKLPALGTKGDVMLADFSKYILGDRMELQIDVSPHVKFINNQMVWRVVWRGDAQPWLNSYITHADGATTVSPFVVLN